MRTLLTLFTATVARQAAAARIAATFASAFGDKANLPSPVPNVRERHESAFYFNMPVKGEDVAALLRPPLVPDLYNGYAWVSVVVDNLVRLEKWMGSWLGFVHVPGSGWMTKVNLFVKDPHTGQQGYLITSIDFEAGLTGVIRSKGAVITQKIPSHTGSFAVNIQKSESHAPTQTEPQLTSVHIQINDAPKTFFNVSAALAPLSTSTFSQFVTNRTTKYLQQFDGKVKCSLELGPGAEFSSEVHVLKNPELAWNVLERLNLTPVHGWVPCQNGTCLFQPVYVLVDHQNSALPCSYSDLQFGSISTA